MSQYPAIQRAAQLLARLDQAATAVVEETLQEFSPEELAAAEIWLTGLSDEELEFACDPAEVDDDLFCSNLPWLLVRSSPADPILEELFTALCE
jgi:hypothetical protein